MEPKKRRGCGGCGVVVIVLLLLVAWAAAMRWGVLEKLGLRQPIAEQVFALPLDREASEALLGALQAAGTDTQGVSLHVLPMAGQAGSAAILTLDASRGFDPERLSGDGGDGDALEQVFGHEALQELGITRVAVDYVDDRGKSIVTLTAPVEALRQLGEEGADEKELLRAVMGRIDIPGLVREVGR